MVGSWNRSSQISPTRCRLMLFLRFLQRVPENESVMTALLEKNPFPDKPPVHVRAVFYDYSYANREEKAKGVW